MRIIILGGGFCGSRIAKRLQKQKNIEVVLIDRKPYFEYSPSLWKLLLNPTDHTKYSVPFSKFLKNTRLITTSMLQVTPTFIQTDTETLSFDYLVICTGIDYPIFLKNTHNVLTIKSGVEIVRNSKHIAEAKSILIVGGGLIGTEIAAELATKSPGKSITLVHSHDRLLERNHKNVSRYAKKFLQDHGINIIFQEKVIDHQNDTFLTNTNRTIVAEVALWCAGVQPNPLFMKEFPSSVFTGNSALHVNRFLQLQGYPNIFAGGDITSLQEEKTAANAKRHGTIILENLLKSMQGKTLSVYRQRKIPMIIDLGRRNAILVYSRFMVPGVIPAIIKQIIEKLEIKRLSFPRTSKHR